MAQHDYDIANQSGANFRADLNNALDAIVSNNSGSSEPSTTFAYEWWVDTTNNLLKLRNSANNAWITLPLSITADNSTSGGLTVNGNLATTGTVDINGQELILDADADTSITADTDDQIDFRVGATDVMTLTNSHLVLKGTTPKITIGDGGEEDTALIFDGNAQDFYIGLDDSADDLIIGKGSTVGTTPAIIIDENLKVGIGTAPSSILHTRTQETTANHNAGGGFHLTSNATAGSRRAEMYLDADNGNFSTSSDGAYAYLQKVGGGGNFNIINQDSADTAFQQGGSEKMRITSSGFIGMGTTNPLSELHISDSGDCGIMLQSTNCNTDKEIFQIIVGANASNEAELIFRTRANAGTGGSEFMRLDSSGNLLIGGTSSNINSLDGVMLRKSGSHGQIFCSGDASTSVETYYVYDNTNSEYEFFVSYHGTVYYRTLSQLSDERKKDNIADITLGLDAIKELRPVSFDWKNNKGNNQLGFIAQEVESTSLKQLVGTYKDKNIEDCKSLNKDGMIPVLVKAIQEQQDIIEDLKSRIETLEG